MAAEGPVFTSDEQAPTAVQNERRAADRLVIDLVDDASTIRSDWERMESDPLNSLHQTFGWCSIWAQTQQSTLLTLRGRQGGKTIFLLPLEIVKEGGIRKARFPGSRFNNINTGLFEPGFAERAGQEIAAAIAREARKLLHGGWKLEGQRLEEVLEQVPVELRDAIARGGDSLFAVHAEGEDGDEDDEQVYHLSRRAFQLNGRPHDLLLVRLLTAELRRQEVQTWKKVIRVISHELNNSLAPIASLAHSGGVLVQRERFDRLPEIFTTIEDRARHLEGFIRGYARFAKLPQPQLQTVHWAPFLSSLRQQIPFTMEREPDEDLSSRIDIAQFGQALLNLLKNAHEACAEADPPNDDVQVQLTRLPQWLRLDVLDRGKGMNEQVLQNALMPFYSTKRNGTGLGLALTREIVEAHGGRVSLQNRGDGGLCVSILLPVG